MVIANANATNVARDVQRELMLPDTPLNLEDAGRQEVRYWFFEREGRRNYIEVRQMISGDTAGNASIALGVPIN